MRTCFYQMTLMGVLLLSPMAFAEKLPGEYYRILGASLESQRNLIPVEPIQEPPPPDTWTRYPDLLLAAAVLYAQDLPENPHHADPKLLQIAISLGDALAKVSESGQFLAPLNSRWLVYHWLESYRLLQEKLEPQRRARWQDGLVRVVTPLAEEVAQLQDYPRYQAPFITTSTNHFSLWASTVYLGGKVMNRPDWESLGAKAMHRLVTSDQAADGFWGEHSDAGPTVGYDYLTLSAVALYAEHSQDPAANEALRRSTNFHLHTTFNNGQPVDAINGRNRYWEISPWGHFGFTHFPQGRRYAEFLLGFFADAPLGKTTLGRIAQNALYFHPGPASPMPLDLTNFEYRMQIPAGIRKTGPWYVCLSGLIGTQAPRNTYFLDRQSHVTLFNEKTGLIITGAGSKRQPELATFTETFDGIQYHMPISSDLMMSDRADRLALAYGTFFSELYVLRPLNNELAFHIDIIRTQGRSTDTKLTLQVVLHAGELLETGSGAQLLLGGDRIDLNAAQIGGKIRHGGWELTSDADVHLHWPIYPHNPYANGPETKLERAVGALVVPFDLDELSIPFERKTFNFKIKVAD